MDVVALQDGKEGLLGSKEASTGVYVGCVWQEYQVLLEHLRVTPTVAVLTGSGMNFMIGRVSYNLGLQGVLHNLLYFPCIYISLRPCTLWATALWQTAVMAHGPWPTAGTLFAVELCAQAYPPSARVST